jgi:hypothetical protein
MAVPAHLIISIGKRKFDSLLSDLRWLVSPDHTPFLMTAFGNLFLRDRMDGVYFLDLMSGEFTQVAASNGEFERLCDDREMRKKWFLSFLLIELRKLQGDLASGECYSCKIPLSLGGQLEPENFERVDLEVHYSVLGQVHQQTKNLPLGTRIEHVKIVSEKPRQ